MNEEIDLSGAWDDLWSALRSGAGIDQILNLLTIVGVALVVIALLKWAWDRRRGNFGGGGGSGAVWGALLVGCILCAPAVILPIGLTILDVVANAGVSIWEQTS